MREFITIIMKETHMAPTKRQSGMMRHMASGFVLFFLLGLLSFFPLSSASSDFLDKELPPKNSMIDDWKRMS